MNSAMHALASAVTEKFIQATPQQAAQALEALATHEVLQLISPLKAQTIILLLNAMSAPKAAAVLRRLALRQASYVLARLQVPQAAKLMQEFSAPYRERISAVLDPAFLKVLQEFESYPEESVGYWMQTDMVSMRTDMKLSQLVERLKTFPRKKIPVLCLVTDKEGVLKGVLRSAELAFYAPLSPLGSVMSECPALLPTDTLSRAKELFESSQMEVLPVVNEQQICLGVLPRAALSSTASKKSFWQKLTK